VLGNGVVVVATREKEQESLGVVLGVVLLIFFFHEGMKISLLNRKWN
jgi:hypothetical protein